MRIIVMGSGGTGGYFGAKLARAGEDVTFVARGKHLAAIRERGLRVQSAIEGEWTVRAPAVERLDGLSPADLVLFCVKSFDTENGAEVIKPIVGPHTGVLSIQNGVDNEDKLAKILGPGHTMGGVAQVFATIAEPGVIRHAPSAALSSARWTVTRASARERFTRPASARQFRWSCRGTCCAPCGRSTCSSRRTQA